MDAADIEPRIASLIRAHALDIEAWRLSDEVETAIWYACRGESDAERCRARRIATLIALAELVRPWLTPPELHAVTRIVPDNLHEIFMRAELRGRQRSLRPRLVVHRADRPAAHQADPVWPPASIR